MTRSRKQPTSLFKISLNSDKIVKEDVVYVRVVVLEEGLGFRVLIVVCRRKKNSTKVLK